MDTPFAHRTNPDASIDSICTTCFQTIASEDNEGKLIAHEERHSCDPYWVFSRARFDSRRSTSASLSSKMARQGSQVPCPVIVDASLLEEPVTNAKARGAAAIPHLDSSIGTCARTIGNTARVGATYPARCDMRHAGEESCGWFNQLSSGSAACPKCLGSLSCRRLSAGRG